MDEPFLGEQQTIQEHVAPRDSSEHRSLRAAARKAGQDEETLRDLLWLINAHDRLLGLSQIALNLLRILQPIRHLLPKGPTTSEALEIFRGWPELLRWIARTHKDAKTEDGLNPVRGQGFLRHPLYACLWERSKDPGWGKLYRLLQWHLVWAHTSYLYKEGKRNGSMGRTRYEAYGEQEMWEAFPNTPYPATLSVRTLAEPGWGPLLGEMQAQLKNFPADFATALSKVECPTQVAERVGPTSNWTVRRDSLQSFLAKANGLRDWEEREGSHTGTSSVREKRLVWSVDETPGDPADPDASWPAGRWVMIAGPLGEFTADEILNLDLDPDEIATPEVRYQVEQELSKQETQQLAVQSALAARGQCRHVQLAHQLLPWQYSQLTLQELAWLLERSRDDLEEFWRLREWTALQYRTAELVALIRVMLWTGSSLPRAYNLRVLLNDDKDEHADEWSATADSLIYDLEKRQWRIHATIPPYKSVIPDPDDQAHRLAKSFSLPDIPWTGEILRRLLERRERNQALVKDDPRNPGGRREEGYVFEADIDDYSKGLKSWLGVGTHDFTGRVTVGRIGKFLFNRLMAVTGDVMAAVSITGHDHPQARTQQFYATYSVASLRGIYVTTVTTIFEQAYVAAKVPPFPTPQSVDRVVDGEWYVGSRLCAKLASVKDAVHRLRDDLDKAMQIGDRSGKITFHNLYTLYTVLMFAYATSIRAIWTPYLWLEVIDESGFTFLSDKNDDAQHKTRLAWVPPLVVEQMRSYAAHLSASASDFPRIVDWPEPCLFLDAKGKPFDVRPSTLSNQMKPYLALPPNAHRRFMRHQLLDRHCPPEVVNAWLGHAFQGEEPWGPYSSFSFAEYRRALELYLLPLLKELGWEKRSPLA